MDELDTKYFRLSLHEDSYKIEEEIRIHWHDSWSQTCGVKNVRLLAKPLSLMIKDAINEALVLVGIDKPLTGNPSRWGDAGPRYYFCLSTEPAEREVQKKRIVEHIHKTMTKAYETRRMPTLTELVRAKEKGPTDTRRERYIRQALDYVGFDKEAVARVFQIVDICTRPLAADEWQKDMWY